MRKLIVIEDSDTDFNILTRSIKSITAEIAIIRFIRGDEALQFLQNKQSPPEVDAILIDLSLPGISGEEVFRRVKNDPQINSVPIFIFSGLPQSYEVKQWVVNGARGILDKECTRADIEEFLQKMTDT